MTQPNDTLIPAGAIAIAEATKATVDELWERAAVTVVITDEDYIAAGELKRQLAERRRSLNETRLGITRPMDEAKARVMALFKPTEERIAEAEKAVDGPLLAFVTERERLASIAAAAAEEEARQQREEAERHAAQLREEGREEEARAVVVEAATAPMPVPAASMALPKVSGLSSTGTWAAEVTDKLALIKYVGEGKAPVDWLDVNMARLNAKAKSDREAMDVPGVRAVRKAGLTAR